MATSSPAPRPLSATTVPVATIGVEEPSPAAYKEYLSSELASESERSLHGIISQIARYGSLKFGALLLNHPFDSARLLRQLQYGDHSAKRDPSAATPLPRPESSLSERLREEEAKLRNRGGYNSRTIGELYADADGSGGGSLNHRSLLLDEYPIPGGYSPDPATGYLPSSHTTSLCLGACRVSQWPLCLDKRYSLWSTIGEISSSQGLFSNWRGIGTAWIHEIAMDLGRATVEETLETLDGSAGILDRCCSPLLLLLSDRHHSALLDPTSQSSPALIELEELWKPCIISSLAQGLVGAILLPLELARVRLAAQSVWANEIKYHGLWDCLRTVSRDEGAGPISSLWRNPFLTFASYAMKPILRIVPLALLSMFFPSASQSLDNLKSSGSSAASSSDSTLRLIAQTLPWLALQGIVLCVPLLVTMPLETIRRRLLVQPLAAKRTIDRPADLQSHTPYITRVQISSTPYTGAWNCAWRMLREEGLGSFYQGWGFQVASILSSYATTLLAEIGEEDLAEDFADIDGF